MKEERIYIYVFVICAFTKIDIQGPPFFLYVAILYICVVNVLSHFVINMHVLTPLVNIGIKKSLLCYKKLRPKPN